MTKPNILIFDFDGTLLDSFGSMKVAAKKTFLELNLPYPGDQTIMHYLHSGKQLNTILQEESYRSEIDINVSLWVDRFYHHLQQNPEQTNHAFPGSITGLKTLKQHGFSLNIASNRSKKSIQSIIEQWEVETLFDCVTGDLAGYRLKPEPDMFVDHIQIQYPNEALTSFLMIGDTQTDIDFAETIGIDCVIMRYSADENTPVLSNRHRTFGGFGSLVEWLVGDPGSAR